MTTVFNDAIIDDKKLKIDVAVILGAMILKHFSDEKTQNRLLEKINMREYESEIQRLAYEEYGHILDPLEEKIQKQSKELETKDKELETKDKELKAINEEIDNLNNFKSESKSKLKKLMESDNFDSNEAKKIINSILML